MVKGIEWHTPKQIVDLAHSVMGDGVFINILDAPETAETATDRFLRGWKQGLYPAAVTLGNNATDTVWFDKQVNMGASGMGLTLGRIPFQDETGKTRTGNTRGQVFFYYGKSPDKFAAAFGAFCSVTVKRGDAWVMIRDVDPVRVPKWLG